MQWIQEIFIEHTWCVKYDFVLLEEHILFSHKDPDNHRMTYIIVVISHN